MSFGGFVSNNTGGSSGETRMVACTAYNTTMPTASMVAQPQLVIHSAAQPVFNSPPISLALKPKMEGLGEMGGMLGENFDGGAMGRPREDDFESRSGSDNLEGASGDEQDIPGDKSSRRKKYHRHTPYQIQELEASFKENPHPDEKARLELGRRLNLESKQVKFWFQNRRTQMKTQLERHENAILKQENDKLRIENIAMKEAMRGPVCSNCGGPAMLGEVSMEEHHLRIENARLRDELNRISILANKFLGKSVTSLAGSMPSMMVNSGLELAVGRNSFGGLSSMDAALSMGLDFGNGVSSGFPSMMPSGRPAMGVPGADVGLDKSIFVELALAAMDELVKLAQIDTPLWFPNPTGNGEVLNLEEYARSFPPRIGGRPSNFITEATKTSGTVIINSIALVETLMDVNRWAELFSCMVGRAATLDVISSGMAGTRNGVLQLMHAELQVLSPLVPVRQVKFLRFCKQHAEGVWAVVDISIDSILEGPNAYAYASCRRLPSGCIVQDMPNGCSKVTWIEHTEYDANAVHHFFRPFIRSGMGFGAQKWITTLQRQCESLATILSATVPNGDPSAITPSGRSSLVKLAQRMTSSFYSGVSATMQKWEVVQVGNAEDGRLMMRRSIGNPGEPPGIVLSATTTVWMPVSHQRLFDFLRNEQTRCQWDVLSHDGLMQQMFNIAKGQDLGNSISLLRANATDANANQSSTLILQETCTDRTGSLIVYAAVDLSAMNNAMNGGDSSRVAILPSGFAIVPDCFQESCDGISTKDGGVATNNNGSLLTVGFQILVNSMPAAKLTMESVDTVNTLISRTLQGIKAALQCS